MGDDTNTGPPSEVDQVVKEMADRAERNQPATYNKLVASALALGMTGMKPVNRFPSSEVGEKRINDLRASIKAFKSGDSAEHPTKGETKMATSAKRKTATKKTVKGKTAKTTTRRAIKSDSARVVRPGIVGEFNTREGTNREKLLKALSSPLGKKHNVHDLCKTLYGNKTDISALKMVVSGLHWMIDNNKLPYTLTSDGRGDEATLTLSKGRGK
jgi:hypothetical protein